MRGKYLAKCALGACFVAGLWSTLTAQNAPATQTYYVPISESSIDTFFQDCNSDANENINTYISVSSRVDNTVLYYDHWEDGYEIDISNPTQSTTEVFNLSAGDVEILDNVIDPDDASVIDYDGRDKIGATKAVAVSRIAWPTDSDILTKLGGAVEVVPTLFWGNEYELPIGENINTSAFQLVSASIIASQDNTSITIDYNSGTNNTNITLDEGETFFIDGFASGITLNAGSTIVSDKPIHVSLMTGDENESYESRWYALLSTDKWDSVYHSPVDGDEGGSSDRTVRVFVYNPNNSSETVSFVGPNGTISSTSISSKSTASFDMQDNDGAKFETSSGNSIYALAVVDHPENTGGQIVDWGYSLIPAQLLSSKFLVGFANGRDPLANSGSNTAPIWVSAISSTFLYVDWDNDGQPDAVDTTGDGNANVSAGTGISLSTLENIRLFRPGSIDQTGAFVYTKTSSTNSGINSGTDGGLIAGAWGQDPALGVSGDVSFDAGVGILPIPQFGGGKNITLSMDRDGDNRISPGDEIEFTITIFNIGSKELELRLIDTLTSIIDYVPNTTTVDEGNGPVSLSDDNINSTVFPLDEGGAILSTNLIQVDSEWTVKFKANIPNNPALCGEVIENEASIVADGISVKTNIARQIADCSILGLAESFQVLPFSEVESNVLPGEVVYPFYLYFFIENLGGNTIENIQLTDDLGAVINDGATFDVIRVESLTSLPSSNASQVPVNNNYDGKTDVELLGSNVNLPAGEMAIIRAKVELNIQGLDRFYEDNSQVSGDLVGSKIQYQDTSTDGFVSDPDGDSPPNPYNNSIPTPISFTALPVELSSFEGKADECSTILEWTTASEENNSHFIVQSSSDGIHFYDVGKVAGFGTTSNPQHYSLIDHAPIGLPKTIYRLLQVDFDGTESYSELIEVNYNGCITDELVSVSVHPSSPELATLHINAENIRNAEVVVVSTLGTIVHQSSLTQLNEGANFETIELPGLGKGIYLVYLYTDTWRSATLKFKNY